MSFNQNSTPFHLTFQQSPKLPNPTLPTPFHTMSFHITGLPDFITNPDQTQRTTVSRICHSAHVLRLSHSVLKVQWETREIKVYSCSIMEMLRWLMCGMPIFMLVSCISRKVINVIVAKCQCRKLFHAHYIIIISSVWTMLKCVLSRRGSRQYYSEERQWYNISDRTWRLFVL